MSFCNVEKQLFDFRRQCSIRQMPSPHRHSRTSIPLRVIIGSQPLASPTSTTDDWFIRVVALATFGQEKFIRSCRCEYVYELGGRSTLEEKGQYVTNAFIITCDYLVFATNFSPSMINVTLCWHQLSHLWLTCNYLVTKLVYIYIWVGFIIQI